jgi:hypothetical protein
MMQPCESIHAPSDARDRRGARAALVGGLAILLAAATVTARAGGAGEIVSLEVYPPAVRLDNARDHQRIVVQPGGRAA